MKIYIAHSRNFDYEKELYEPLRKSSMSQKHEFVFPHEHGDQMNSKDALMSAKLVIAEVSHPSTGLGIELGWANANEIPIVAVYRSGSQPAPALGYLGGDIIEYEDENDLIAKLGEKVSYYAHE